MMGKRMLSMLCGLAIIAIVGAALWAHSWTPRALEAGEEPIVIVDESANFSQVFDKSLNVQVSTSSPERYGGDASRFYKSSNEPAYIVYAVAEDTHLFTGFEVISWYNRSSSNVWPGDMSFEASSDHGTYSPLTGVVKTVSPDPLVGGWGKITWSLETLPAETRYVKLVYGDTSAHPSAWAIQIGKTTLYAKDSSREMLQDAIDEAEELLSSAVVGTAVGQYPQTAVDALDAAIVSAQGVADDNDATTTALQTAYASLQQARTVFEQSVILALNWPANAEVTAISTGLTQMSISWPAIVEAAGHPGVVYEVYRNGVEVAVVTGTTYAFTQLKPQMAYTFTIVARDGADRSRELGPETLSTSPLPVVPAPDFSLIDPADFADEDFIAPTVWVNETRGIPYYYKHFHTVANAVRLDEPYRGFIDIVVHRNAADNQPYNARVQENYLWMAYFYSNPAEWNIYYGMPEVKYRLEAALEHLLTLQSSDGAFSEYSWGGYNLPGTSFALQFLSQTVRLLNEAKAADPAFPSIDEEVYDRVIDASLKAIDHVLNNNAFWTHGTGFTNQYTLMWSATAAFLAYYPDAALETRMLQRFADSEAAFISPAGFYYENNAYDMGYNVGVHIQNMMADYHYFKDTALEQDLIDKESKFIEWLAYNMVLQPDGSFFTSNAAPSGRTGSAHYTRKDIPLAEKLPLARAFVRTQSEVTAEIAAARAAVVKDGIWPNVPNLSLNGGNSYNPYGLYNRILYRYFPTDAERDAAIALLPYMASDRFNHQRIDDRSAQQFTYVRRPYYYAAFNAGPRKANQQVFGLGLLWHPSGGVMLSSQTENSSASPKRGLSWGTQAASAAAVYENGNVQPTYTVGGSAYTPTVGAGNIAAGDVSMQYNLGSAGSKTVAFEEDGVSVQVTHTGAFLERLPLMVGPSDVVTTDTGKVTLVRGNAKMEITFDSGATADLTQKSFRIYDHRMHMLTLEANGSLNYSITMSVTEPE